PTSAGSSASSGCATASRSSYSPTRPGWSGPRPNARSVGGGLDLDHNRQDHRPAPQPVVDERGQVVMQLLLEHVDLAHPVVGRVGQGALDLGANVLDQAVGLLDEPHA